MVEKPEGAAKRSSSPSIADSSFDLSVEPIATATPEDAVSRRMRVSSFPVVGVLMLDTRFRGDTGNPRSIPYPSRYRRVATATVARVTGREPLPEALFERFVETGHELIADGATLLVTNGALGALSSDRREGRGDRGMTGGASALSRAGSR